MKSSRETLQNLPYFIKYENPKLLCPFFILCYFIFSLMVHRLGHSWGEKKWTSTKWKTEKATLGFCIYEIWQIWSISPGHFIKHKPLISEECIYVQYNDNVLLIMPLFKGGNMNSIKGCDQLPTRRGLTTRNKSAIYG